MLACRRIKNFIILQILVSVSPLHSYAQDYSFIRYDTRDGLAGSVVYDAIQDKEGFMWFATENGLSRFDGKNFKTFTTKDGLPDNEILKLFVDSKGRLWIMPFKPSICYYYKGKIYNKSNDSLVSKINLFNYAFDMAEDSSGSLFIIEIRAWHEILKDQTIRTIDSANNLLILVGAVGTNRDGRVELFDVEYKTPEDPHFFIHTDGETTELKNRFYWPEVQSSVVNQDYVIVPSGRSTRLSFYKDASEVISTKIPSNTVSITYIDKRKITINTRTGIQFFDPVTKRFSDLFFKDFSFTSAFHDKENNLWLTTAGYGILMVPSLQFRNYSFAEDKKNPEITALSITGDTLYAAGWDKRLWKATTANLAFSSRTGVSPEGAKVVAIFPINNKPIVFNSAYYQNPFNLGIKVNQYGISLKSVSIGKSGLLIASHSSTLLCKRSGGEEIIWNERSTSAVEKDSGFYIGTLNGLIYKSYQGKTINLGKIFPELASRIVNLAISYKNILWVTTKGNGIAAYSDNKLLYHFTEANGLTSDNCTSLYLDSNTVWLGTDKGLNRIEFLPQEIRSPASQCRTDYLPT